MGTFFRIFSKSPVSHIGPKNVKGGLWEFLNIRSFAKKKIFEGGPVGDIKKNCEKKFHKTEITCTKKFWSRARLEPTSFCLADLKKSSKNQKQKKLHQCGNYKAYKICHFVGLKKRKVTTIVCIFLRKTLTKSSCKAEVMQIT